MGRCDIKGWKFLVDSEGGNNEEKHNSFSLECNTLGKFENDTIKIIEKEKGIYIDGYITSNFAKEKIITWFHENVNCIDDIELRGLIDILRELRGGFCGLLYNNRKVIFFNDQVGNRAVYYYIGNKNIILASRWNMVVNLLKEKGIKYSFDEQMARYILTYGYALDDSTFSEQIKRVLPGQIIEIDLDTHKIWKQRYYMLSNSSESISETDAIERMDNYFRRAIEREFSKDLEYEYKHLVDLSGGLDSRMTTWVAHEMGYSNQVNVTYCQSGYLDYRISQEIAKYLNHEYIFKFLDDFKWYMDVDEIVQKNNGAALYTGISGGYRLLDILNMSKFGIEHTGMMGDVIFSTFYKKVEENYAHPVAGELQYSNKIECTVPQNVLNEYENKELLAIYTRGMLGAQSSYFIRQNYIETSSPFMDVDLMQAMYKIPFEQRANNNLYLKWISKKYPKAGDFGWERWRGTKPQKNQEWKKYVRYIYYRLTDEIKKKINISDKNVMVPMDYFYSSKGNVRDWANSYFKDYCTNPIELPELNKDLCQLFLNGNAQEKAQTMTVMSVYKNYFRG